MNTRISKGFAASTFREAFIDSSVVKASWWVAPITLSVGLAAMLVVKPLIAAAIIVAVIVGGAVARRRIGFLLLLTLSAFVIANSNLLDAFQLDSGQMNLARFVLTLSLAAAVVPLAVNRKERTGLPKAFITGSFGLVLLAFASGLTSVDPFLTLVHALALAAIVAATTISLVLSWESPSSLVRTLQVFFWVAVIVTTLSFVAGPFGISSHLAGRFRGILANPNTLGFWLAPVFPFSIVLIVTSRNFVGKAMIASGAAILVVALVLSGSRGGLLAVVAGALAVVLVVRHRIRLLVVTVLIVGVLALVLPERELSIRPTGEPLLSLGTGSGRTPVWRQTLLQIRERPLTGWGFGTIGSAPLLPDVKGYAGPGVANGYLAVALEIGIPASLLVFGLGLWSAIVALRSARRTGIVGVLAAGMFGSIFGGFVENVFESGFTAVGGLFILPFWTAMAAAQTLRLRWGRPENARWFEPRRTAKQARFPILK